LVARMHFSVAEGRIVTGNRKSLVTNRYKWVWNYLSGL